MIAAAALALAVAAVATVAIVRAVGDENDGSTTRRLVDGSLALAEPLGLPQGVAGVMRVRRAEDVAAGRLRACLRLVALPDLPGGTLVVERIGVEGRSLTFRDPRVPRLYGCDASVRSAEGSGPWCGAAVGTLASGRLLDPRLDLVNCLDAAGRPVAFAWIELPQAAEWLALERDGTREYYGAGGNLPVRVASAGAVSGSSSASFTLTTYGPGDAEGERRTLRAAVSG